MASGADVSLIGAEMPLPPGVRRVPIEGPTPVFAWFAYWRGARPSAVLKHVPLAGTDNVAASWLDDDQVWLPAADRALLRNLQAATRH